MSADGAHVSSTEAIERFRARLIIYRDKIKPLLADAADEVSRTREWLVQRRQFWESEVRRRRRLLDDAKQALFSARFSNLREVKAAEQMAVHRAEKAIAQAEERLASVKRWAVAFDQQVGPLVKHVEQLRTIASTNLAKADEFLARILVTLDQYSRLAATEPGSPEAPSPEPPEPPSSSAG